MKVTFKPYKSAFLCGNCVYSIEFISAQTKEVLWEGYSWQEIPQEYLDVDPVEITFTNNYNNTPVVKIYIND